MLWNNAIRSTIPECQLPLCALTFKLWQGFCSKKPKTMGFYWILSSFELTTTPMSVSWWEKPSAYINRNYQWRTLFCEHGSTFKFIQGHWKAHKVFFMMLHNKIGFSSKGSKDMACESIMNGNCGPPDYRVDADFPGNPQKISATSSFEIKTTVSRPNAWC